MTATWVVISTLPDQASAERLADHLVGERVAACVNILAPCRSVYRWEGKVERANEVPVFIKTTSDRYAALEAAIRAVHPYSVPEIVAIPAVAGWPAYLAWVADETSGPADRR